MSATRPIQLQQQKVNQCYRNHSESRSCRLSKISEIRLQLIPKHIHRPGPQFHSLAAEVDSENQFPLGIAVWPVISWISYAKPATCLAWCRDSKSPSCLLFEFESTWRNVLAWMHMSCQISYLIASALQKQSGVRCAEHMQARKRLNTGPCYC